MLLEIQIGSSAEFKIKEIVEEFGKNQQIIAWFVDKFKIEDLI